MTVLRVCMGVGMIETRMSACPFGCKVYRCPECGWEPVHHLKVYGHAVDSTSKPQPWEQ